MLPQINRDGGAVEVLIVDGLADVGASVRHLDRRHLETTVHVLGLGRKWKITAPEPLDPGSKWAFVSALLGKNWRVKGLVVIFMLPYFIEYCAHFFSWILMSRYWVRTKLGNLQMLLQKIGCSVFLYYAHRTQ